MSAVSFARRSFFFVLLPFTLAAGLSEAAGICGAHVTVRQIKLTPNEDGTRTVRYRASVQTDQPACARVSFTIVRSYIKPDGTAFEDAIPVEVQVPGRTVDVEADTLANTRRLIYWRAEKVICQPCAGAAGNLPAAPMPSASSSPAVSSAGTTEDHGGSGWSLPHVGPKAAIAGGAAAAVATGAVLAMGGSSGTTPGANETPAPRPTPAATAAPAPTSPPTPTPVPTPVVFPGAPPASPGGSASGDITLIGSDPVAGSPVSAQRASITVRLQLYAESVGSDNRLEVQLWSGGELCVRDTSAPLEIKANQPYAITFPMSNVRRCAAPFRTTLLRVYLNDRGLPKLVADFPVGFDFVP